MNEQISTNNKKSFRASGIRPSSFLWKELYYFQKTSCEILPPALEAASWQGKLPLSWQRSLISSSPLLFIERLFMLTCSMWLFFFFNVPIPFPGTETKKQFVYISSKPFPSNTVWLMTTCCLEMREFTIGFL